jgi:hypothetical protein
MAVYSENKFDMRLMSDALDLIIVFPCTAFSDAGLSKCRKDLF